MAAQTGKIRREGDKMSDLKYVIIGAGGTGGILGFYMTKAGKDVTLIARGQHLKSIQENGLTVEKMWDNTEENVNVKAADMQHFIESKEKADVILVCVKGYSLDDTYDFIKQISNENTVVIPVLNIYGTGAKMQEKLQDMLVTDGCIYVSANIKSPGVLIQHGKILRVVYGVRNNSEYRPVLSEIKLDFDESGIEGVLTEHIQRDALEKFSYVSPAGAAGLYYDAVASDFQKEGAAREMLKGMMNEIAALAAAMGYPFDKDMVEVNLKIMSTLAPDSTTSMQRDVMAGKKSEADGLIFEVVRLGKKYNVPVPYYEKAAKKFEGKL